MTARGPKPADDDGAPLVLRAGKMVGGGRVLVHHGGETWMVAGALPGELVSVRPYNRRAGIVEGVTLEVLEAAHPARVAEPCPHAPGCGGCDWPHVDPVAGARLKVQATADAARGAPELARLITAAAIHLSPLGYRLRARLHWDPESRRLGFFAPRSHVVSPIEHCRIVSPLLLSVLPHIGAALARRCPAPLEVVWLEGSDPTRGVAAVRAPRRGPRIQPEWLPERSELPPSVAGCHILDRTGSVGDGWGSSEVVMELSLPLGVPVGAFFQGNRHLVRALFDRVAELAGADGEPVFDLHAGVGYLAAAVRSRGPRPLVLVEPHREAARAAARNLPDARVEIGSTAERFLESMRDAPRDTLVITDPPRSGLSPAARGALSQWRPRRILMLGCDPATWARDAGALVGGGYRVASIELFDLFPSTHHVEILALLERT